MSHIQNNLGRLIVIVAVAVVSSCLGEPEIDERWTKLELVQTTPRPNQSSPADQPLDVTVRGRITYRRIQTGTLVAEVRYSDVLAPGSLRLDPEEHTLEASQDVDRILANSTSMGRATRAVTGFDHLMQDVDFSFTAQIPPDLLDNPSGGLYLLLYMGDGDEVRLDDGRDSLLVSPYPTGDREILHTGFPLAIDPPTGSAP
jgi:hypothetical protein